VRENARSTARALMHETRPSITRMRNVEVAPAESTRIRPQALPAVVPRAGLAAAATKASATIRSAR
jgi:hypothetical protein